MRLFLLCVLLGASFQTLAVEPPVAPVYTGIDHVSLRVVDPQRSLKFYSHLFGGESLKPAQGTVRYLQLGASFVVFNQDQKAALEYIGFGVAQFDRTKVQNWFKREALTTQPLNNGLRLQDRDGAKVLVAAEGGWQRLLQGGAVADDSGSGAALFHALLIDEIHVTVTNMEVDSLYYARLLGKSGTLQAGSLWFTVGGARLRLSQAPVRQKPAPNYFSVLVSNTDLEQAADAVFKAGGIIENILPNGFSFWDPDGIRVEIHVASQL